MICTNTQGFYENVANAYAPLGMKGHGGEDVNCGYGSPIEFPLEGVVSNVLDDKHPASDGYWGIYVICYYKGQLGELCVGHCSRIDVKVGDRVTKGQIVGLEGNHGYVFQDGIQITLALQAQGDQRGHHRHWQWRPLIKNVLFTPLNTYITSWSMGTYRDMQGIFYQVQDPLNGYKGLSPDILNILDDYDARKAKQSPTPTPVNDDIMKQQTLFVKILEKFLTILKSFKS